MRKECVSEPSLNGVESGNAEKALMQVYFNKEKQGDEKNEHILGFKRVKRQEWKYAA